MIDHDISHQLHSLAATVDERLDLAALHRRITLHNRRRAAAKVGFAGAGVAAVVGGLFVVTSERSAPSQSGFASAPVEPTAFPSESSPTIEDPAALPDCATVLAEIAARPTSDSEAPKLPDNPASADELGERGFKGIVTITAIAGPQVSFDVDEPALTAISSGVGVVDDATEWVDGATPLTSPPALAVGQQLGLATRQDDAGVEHVIYADVSAIPSEAQKDDSKPVIDPTNLSDDELKKAVEAAKAASAEEDKAPAAATEGANISVPGEPTEKANATITAADATTVTASFEDPVGQPATVTIDIATTTFYADQTVCAPGVLTVGDQIGIAYHLGDGDIILANAVMLIP